ncbi:MAG: CapA family protein [Thermomicrobiales bacterium]
MDRPPEDPTSPTRRPHLPDLPDPQRPAAGGGTGGDLPPWSSFGLDPDSEPTSDPAFDADWNPLGGTWDDAAVPVRSPPRRRRRALILVAVACAVLLAIGTVTFLALTGDDGDDDPPDAALGAPTGESTTAGAGVLVSPSTDGPTPPSGQPTQDPTAPPTTAAALPTSTPSGPLLVAVVDATVGGIAATDLAVRIERALADLALEREIRIVGADQAAAAVIVLAGAPPGAGYETRMVASEPLAAITSPRLPLYGVGREQIDRLLRGEVASWLDAGAAIDLPVVPLALRDTPPAGATPVAAYDDYEQLVAGFDEHRGGVALVPVSQVDFRVNVLAVDGVDPLRGRASGDYPYFRRLYLGVRRQDAATLRPAVDVALGALGSLAATPTAANNIATVGFVGDVVPGRNVAAKIEETGDPASPFRDVAGQLASYDLTVANLEGALSETIEPPDDPHTFTFVADPNMLEGVELAGIDGVTLANNHALNSGVEGLQDTTAALDEAGIRYTGAGNTLDEAREPAIFQVNGLTIAVLGINGVTANPNDLPGVVSGEEAATADAPGTNPFVADQFLADIRAATERADIVIPYFHMGVEYRDQPPDWAVEAAHAAIDAGAAMVVANHPHVIQGMEIYEGRPILYSLGNFVFDQAFSIEVRTGMILEVTFRGTEIAGLRLHGVEIEDFHRPRPMTGGEQAALLDRFWRLTDTLATRSED